MTGFATTIKINGQNVSGAPSFSDSEDIQFTNNNGSIGLSIVQSSISDVKSVTNTDGLLNISPNTGKVVVGVNVSANFVWGGTHTFNNQVTVAGPLKVTSGTPGVNKLLASDATGNASWQPLVSGTGISVSGLTISNSGVTSAVAGNGISVSASTGAVTFSSLLNGTTLLNSSGGLSLNLGNANTWTALQTFGSNISFNAVSTTNASITFTNSAGEALALNGLAVTTVHNSLDDGSGNASVEGLFTVGGSGIILSNRGTLVGSDYTASVYSTAGIQIYNTSGAAVNALQLTNLSPASAGHLDAILYNTAVLDCTPYSGSSYSQLLFAIYNTTGNTVNMMNLQQGLVKMLQPIATPNGGTAPTGIAAGASPFTYTNAFGNNIIVYVAGGTVNALSVNGTSIVSGLTFSGVIPVSLKPGDSLTVTYTTAPNMYYLQA